MPGLRHLPDQEVHPRDGSLVSALDRLLLVLNQSVPGLVAHPLLHQVRQDPAIVPVHQEAGRWGLDDGGNERLPDPRIRPDQILDNLRRLFGGDPLGPPSLAR